MNIDRDHPPRVETLCVLVPLFINYDIRSFLVSPIRVHVGGKLAEIHYGITPADFPNDELLRSAALL